MSLVTINDVGVISGTIMMPLRGVWTADLVIDQPNGDGFAAGTAVTLAAADGIELHGTVAADRSGDFLDAVHVRVLGGAGGMGVTCTARGYAQPGAYARDVLQGIAGDAGETLSSDIAASLTGTNLTAWALAAVPASQALTALLDIVSPDADWRILPDGKLWAGTETWPASSVTYDVVDNDPSQKSYRLGLVSPSIYPGYDLDGVGKVARVEHVISPESIRATVWVDLPDDERGIRAAVARMVRQETARVDYFAMYDAKIVSQAADGTTVDVQPGDPRLPGLSAVPLRNGVAGTVCKVSPGTFVRLGWDRGDPSRPFACLWQGGETVTEIQIAGSLVPFVKGASNELGTLTLTVGGGATLAWTYVDAAGVSTSGASGAPITLTGKTAQKVKVG